MKIYTLQFTDDMLKVIGGALGEIPTKLGMPVTLEINKQLAEQQKPKVVRSDNEQVDKEGERPAA